MAIIVQIKNEIDAQIIGLWLLRLALPTCLFQSACCKCCARSYKILQVIILALSPLSPVFLSWSALLIWLLCRSLIGFADLIVSTCFVRMICEIKCSFLVGFADLIPLWFLWSAFLTCLFQNACCKRCARSYSFGLVWAFCSRLREEGRRDNKKSYATYRKHAWKWERNWFPNPWKSIFEALL